MTTAEIGATGLSDAEHSTQLRRAVKLKPGFIEAHINLANTLVAGKNLDGALNEAQAAVKLAPNNADAHRTLGRVLSFQQDIPGAVGEFHRAIELAPARPDLHDELGALLVQNPERRIPRSSDFSRGLEHVIEDLNADYVVIDSPPLTLYADALAIAGDADATVVAVRLGRSRRGKRTTWSR